MASQKSIRWPNPTLPDSVYKMFDMHGKVVIITGGSGGIGNQVRRGLAEAGTDIALWYNTSTQAESRGDDSEGFRRAVQGVQMRGAEL